MKKAFTLASAILQTVLAVGTFPPDEPVSVGLNLVTDPNIGTRAIWLPVKIGGEDRKVVIDTGSIILWAMTDLLTDPKYKDNRKIPIGNIADCEVFDFRYADGTFVSGVWLNRDVTISGYTRPGFRFLGVDEIENDPEESFSKFNLDGVLGASAKGKEADEDDESPPLPPPWLFDTAFTIKISRAGESTLTLADTNYKSKLTVPLSPEAGSYWVIESSNMGRVLLDSGSESLLLWSTFVKEYMAKVTAWPPSDKSNDSGFWQVQCSADLPNIEVTVEGGSIQVSSKYFREAYYKQDPENRCRVRVVEIPDASFVALLGLPLFEANTVTFDGPGNKIGITPND